MGCVWMECGLRLILKNTDETDAHGRRVEGTSRRCSGDASLLLPRRSRGSVTLPPLGRQSMRSQSSSTMGTNCSGVSRRLSSRRVKPPFSSRPTSSANIVKSARIRKAAAACGGEWRVGAAGAGEFGIDFDRVADIHDQQERRAAFGGWQGAGVLFGLAAGAQHGVIPGDRTAVPHPFACRLGGLQPTVYSRNPWRISALLGFQYETLAPIEVDAAGAGGAVAVLEGHGAFEDIGIGGIIRRGGVRPRHTQHVAQFREEELVVGAFRRTRLLPAGDESGGIGEVLRGGAGLHYGPLGHAGRMSPVYDRHAEATRRESDCLSDGSLAMVHPRTSIRRVRALAVRVMTTQMVPGGIRSPARSGHSTATSARRSRYS